MVYGEGAYGEAPYAESGDSGPVLRQAVEHSTALPVINPSAGAIPRTLEHSHALPLSPGQVLGVARDRQDAGRLTPSTGAELVAEYHTPPVLDVNTPTVVSVTGPVLSGDVIVVLDSGNFTAANQWRTSVSGLGATWEIIPDASNSVYGPFRVWVGTGATSAGDVTASGGVNLGSRSSRSLHVYHLRGVSGDGITGANSSNGGSGGATTLPTLVGGAGGAVLAWGYSDTSADALSDVDPDAGWDAAPYALHSDTRWMHQALRYPDVSGPHTISATRAGGPAYTSGISLPASTEAPPTALPLGQATETDTAGSLRQVVSGSTTNRIGGRRRIGLGSMVWEPPVEPVPAAFTIGEARETALAFSPVTVENGLPTYGVAAVSRERLLDRLVIGGRDVTYFRGAPTPFPGYGLVEPFMYGPTQITFPQIATAFETPGVEELRWCREWATVEVHRVDPETNEVVEVDYRGLIVGYDTDGGSLTLQVGGELTGRAAMAEKQVPIFTSQHDLGRYAYRGVRALGLRFDPYLGPTTGIKARAFGGMSMLEYLHQIVATSWTRSGNRWTIMPVGKGLYEMFRKDKTTIHGTVYADDTRTVAALQRDLTEEPNRIFMTGIDPTGQRVRFGQYPGLKQSPIPRYPFDDGRSFGAGTTNEDTDTGDGITILINRLRITKYMNAIDAPGGYDQDVTRGVRELQRDAGLNVTGNINRNTWAALYDLTATGFSLRWSSIQPAAQTSAVQRWFKSPSGAQMRRNPGYKRHVPKVDRNVDAGSGFTRSDLREWAESELEDATGDNWVGTLTFNTGALVKGSHTPGDPITDADFMSARDLRPGMNLRLPLFSGGITVHVSAVTVSAEGVVSADVDSRARDAMEVWEIIARNRESRRSPYREWLRQHRQSGQTKDANGVWDEVGGTLGVKVPIPKKTWYVFPVVAGQEGTIRSLRVNTNPNAEFVMAVFGKKIGPGKLKRIIGDPLTKEGSKRWEDEDRLDRLDRENVLLYVAGSDEEPCGYAPRKKGRGPRTGRWVDDAGFPYHTGANLSSESERQPVLWVAVFADRDTNIPGGRIMWPTLESGV